MEQSVQDARAKLAARFAGNNQLGGKGTQRRVKKVVTAKAEVNEDKKFKATIKKFGMQPLSDIDEVNMFKDDNTVIHFKKPQASFSVRESLLVVTGNPETRGLQSLLPDILKQVGPAQYQYLKDTVIQNPGAAAGATGAGAAEDDDDDVPELVGTFDNVQ